MIILLADDDPITLDALRACLEPEGFTALLARHGGEALALWEKHRPDLLCLDVMMPQVDGYEVCRRVRASDPQVPVLFLSAKSEEIDVVVGLQLGADDFIRKPFGKHELLARIRAVLRRMHARHPRARSFCLHDLVIYPRELRAERAGDSIDLSPREAGILEVLHEQAGQVVDRDTLSIVAGGSIISPSPARSTSTSPSCASGSNWIRRIRRSLRQCEAWDTGTGRRRSRKNRSPFPEP